MSQTFVDLLPSDVVELERGVVLRGTVVVDKRAGQRIQLNPSAVKMVEKLDGERNFKSCARVVAGENDWDRAEVTRDFAAVVDALDRAAVLRIRRQPFARFRRASVRTPLSRGRGQKRPRAQRFPPTVWGVAKACFLAARSATGVGVGLSGAVILCDALLGIVDIDLGTALIPALLGIAFPFHLFAHEAAHLLGTSVLGGVPCMYAMVRGSQVAVIHPRLSGSASRITALVGPLSGVLGALLLAGLVTVIPNEAGWLPTGAVPGACLAVSGLMHLLSLGPWAADGKILWSRRDKQGALEIQTEPRHEMRTA